LPRRAVEGLASPCNAKIKHIAAIRYKKGIDEVMGCPSYKV